jgi:hypothetical protein
VSYITIQLPFNVSGKVAGELLSTAWLFRMAVHRVLDTARQHEVLPRSRIGWERAFHKVAYDVIPQSDYADGAVVLVMGAYKSCRVLGLDFKSVELSDWLLFQPSKLSRKVGSIALKPNYEFHVSVIGYDGSYDRVVLRPVVSGDFSLILDSVLDYGIEYMGRIVVRDYGVRDGKLWVRGGVHLTVPLLAYYKIMARYLENNGSLQGGVDVNVDRINLAIIGEDGELIDHRTFWYREVTSRGYPRGRAWSIIGMRIHELLNYARNNGVRVLYLENPGIIGKLRLMWVRNGNRGYENYNYRVSAFRSTIVEKIAMKAPLYSISVGYVNPRGTSSSKAHDELMRRHGLDRHTASAYLIALMGTR